MSGTQWALLVVAAVLAFWAVGAHNRLVAHRNAIADAFRHVDDAVQRRAAAATALADLARTALASEAGSLDAWLAAHTATRQAADALRARPVQAPLAAALAASEAPLAAATARVLALLDQHPSLTADASVAALGATLRETEARLVFARQLFNEAVQAYNEAARQLPTRWLARVLGFGTAGRL
ncbi:MAG: LemA family protein [Rubrivivax sp.]|nr:LemA family protein [Rubrivivax sp.]